MKGLSGKPRLKSLCNKIRDLITEDSISVAYIYYTRRNIPLHVTTHNAIAIYEQSQAAAIEKTLVYGLIELLDGDWADQIFDLFQKLPRFQLI